MNPTRRGSSDDRGGCAESRARSRAHKDRHTPEGLEQRLLVRAREAGLGRADRVIVGFSGGRDSLVLAAALRWTQEVLGFEPLLVHVDHRLRSTSGEEAARAERLAAALGLEFRLTVASGPPQELHPNVGMEEAARRERYRLLFETADEMKAQAVATAHHERDQAETVLLHLLRGGGVHGAAGMGERSPAPVPQPPPNDISPKDRIPWLWRPFLRESRETIDDYADRLGLVWIEDPSNDDLALRRNALRRQILPVLEQQFPGAIAGLARYGRLAAADDEALDHIARAALAGEVDPGGRVSVAALRDNPLGVQRRMIRRWLSQVTGSTAFTAERTDALLQFARAGSGGSGGSGIEMGEGWTVRREGGMLRALRAASERKEPT